MTDLVKALRDEAALLFSPGFSLIQTKNLMIEAAAEIERLETALKPFADYAEKIDSNYTSQGYGNQCPLTLNPECDSEKNKLHLGHCRQARKELA
jgi:hypothetical protein